MEGLKVSNAELMVYLPPSKSKNVNQSIYDEFSSMLFKFNETFDGVLLAHSVSTNDELAKILPGLHLYFGVRLKAQLLLFYPKPNMLLEGKVVKLGPQSIHIVVLGFSSATIIEEDIREEFDYKVKHGKELFASSVNKKHKIEIDSVIRFVVKSFDEEVLHISGSLLPSHTGNVSWLDKYADEDLVESYSKKRRDLQTTDHSKQTTDGDRIKKSKKHKSSHS
ncbi:uncharacterized protein LOC143592404 [Bidens hawaiensis]|uniref:uncharacterized protein LOC143592404 n=1 Tax=Bidens hawaiensis TaxID=980011 RepID=UPI00404A09EF